MKNDLRETILRLALPLIEAQGLELWGLDLIPGPALTARLYVYCPGSSGESAGIDQCESISRQLSLAMDVEDCIDQPWTLEVSSPGLERKFFSLAQMAPYVGDMVEARLNEPLGEAGRKVWRGRLLGVDGSGFNLEPAAISADGNIAPEGGGAVAIPWSAVARARRIHVFAQPQKPGKSSSSRKKPQPRSAAPASEEK